MIRAASLTDLMASTGEALGLTSVGDVAELVKPALRRAVFRLAPCSGPDLVRFVSEPLQPFGETKEVVEDALKEMVTYGDILEMRRLESDPWDAPAYVLRPAPPSFVLRSNDEAIILGVSGELTSALTAELEDQVRVVGPVRILKSQIDNLAMHLKLLGLTQLTENAWLRTPSSCSAQHHFDDWKRVLDSQARDSKSIDGLELLDPTTPTTYYKGRWRPTNAKDSGIYVARRSQQYGAKLWSLVEIEHGVPIKVLDFQSDDQWQRPRDLAWRLQSAIDALLGHPHTVDVRQGPEEASLGFHLPIPSFAERRLAICGSKTVEPGALFSFRIPNSKNHEAIAALQEDLWMQPITKGDIE